MKKTYLFLGAVLLLVTGMMTSCKKYKEDLDLLRHPIHVKADVSPNMGVPFAVGQLNFNDLLKSIDNEYAGFITNEEVITIVYDTSFADTIDATSSTPTSHARPSRPYTKDDQWVTVDTTWVYPVKIDFFNKMDSKVNDILDQISIDSLVLDIMLNLKAIPRADVESTVRGNVKAELYDLIISYKDHNGQSHPFGQTILDDTIHLDNLLDGHVVDIDDINLADIFFAKPQEVTTSVSLSFHVKKSWLLNQDFTDTSFAGLLENAKMTSFAYRADVSARLPLKGLNIGNLSYSYVMPFGSGNQASGIEHTIDSLLGESLKFNLNYVFANLHFDNGIPLDLRMSAVMLDQDSVEIKDSNNNVITFFTGDTTIISQALLSNTTPAYAIGSTPSDMTVQIDHYKLEKMKNAKFLKLYVGIGTLSKRVNIRRDDFLKIKVYVKASAGVSADIKITDKGLF